MIKGGFILLLLLLTVGSLGFSLTKTQNPLFETLNGEEMHQRIIGERDLAIQKAIEAGDYRCCVEPPCTMCYMEANRWNNFTAGTCACDDLIAQGKEPCPQCKNGLCETDAEGACKVNGNKE